MFCILGGIVYVVGACEKASHCFDRKEFLF